MQVLNENNICLFFCWKMFENLSGKEKIYCLISYNIIKKLFYFKVLIITLKYLYYASFERKITAYVENYEIYINFNQLWRHLEYILHIYLKQYYNTYIFFSFSIYSRKIDVVNQKRLYHYFYVDKNKEIVICIGIVKI